MNYNTFLIRYGISPDNFKAVVAEPIKTSTGYMYCLEQRTDINRQCPFCDSKSIIIKDYDMIKTNISINDNSKDFLMIKKVRFKCKRCNKTYTPEIEGIKPYNHISNLSKNYITWDFYKKLSYTQIAEKYDVSVGYVIHLFDETFPYIPRKKLPKILCIDEFHFSKIYDQKYCCVLTDFETGEVIDIIKNRQKAYLEEYFTNISLEEREQVTYFVSDMYDEYGIIQRKFFPNSIHVIDMFHIICQLTNAINIVRTRTMNKMVVKNSLQYNFMKKNWRYFLCRKERIPNKTYTYKATKQTFTFEELVYMCIRSNPDLLNAHNVLQDIYKYAYYKSEDEIAKYMTWISDRLLSSDDEEIKKVGRTYLKWMYGITNAFTKKSKQKRLTNGIAESINNHIKTTIKYSYGFENFERFRKRALLIFSKNKVKKEW